MPVSGLKRINSPRNIITKHNNVDKVKIPKLSRSHEKQRTQNGILLKGKLEEWEARQKQ